MDFKKERGKFKPCPNSHSSWLIISEDGRILWEEERYICYAPLRYNEIEGRLFVFFGKNKIGTAYRSEDWANWIINHEVFGIPFITKDAKEGFEYGFEVDINLNRDLVAGCITILRWLFERPRNQFGVFLDMGFKPHEAYALSSNFRIDEDYIKYNSELNSHHVTITQGQNLGYYNGKGLRSFSPKTLYKNPFAHTGLWNIHGTFMKEEKFSFDAFLNRDVQEIFPELSLRKASVKNNFDVVVCKKPRVSKNNLNKILKYMRTI